MRTKLQPGETVALIVRKHWLVLVKPALFVAAVLFYLPIRHVKILGFEALLNYLLPYAVAVSGGLFLYRYLDRRVNIWAVTNERLIDEWGILTHKSKENPLDKINDIVVEQTILGRLFGYGGISVQTAAKAGETIIEFVEKPEELKQTINEQKALRAERGDGPDAGGAVTKNIWPGPKRCCSMKAYALHSRCVALTAVGRSPSITPGEPATTIMRPRKRQTSGSRRPASCPSLSLLTQARGHQPVEKQHRWRPDQGLR